MKTNKNAYFAMQGGKVGIGTDNPQTRLHIKDGMLTIDGVSETFHTWNVRLRSPLNSIWLTGNEEGNQYIGLGITTNGMYMLKATGTSGDIYYPLIVNDDGRLFCTEVNVNPLQPWGDYVFEDNYSLLPLNQLEEFIKKNKHLPEIPKATEIEKNGISLGEMNTLLMKKIEELTLYVIELKKEVDALKK